MIIHNNTLQELNKVSDNRIIDIGKALLHGYMPPNVQYLITDYSPPKVFIFVDATISQASSFANILPSLFTNILSSKILLHTVVEIGGF